MMRASNQPTPNLPETLHLHVSQPAPWPHMDHVVAGTLRYGPRPAALSQYIQLEVAGYYSETPHTARDGSVVWLHLARGAAGWNLILIFDLASKTNQVGGMLVMSWPDSLPGNTGEPFRLANGGSHHAGFRRQNISVDAEPDRPARVA
jgi:hypothetical protein